MRIISYFLYYILIFIHFPEHSFILVYRYPQESIIICEDVPALWLSILTEKGKVVYVDKESHLISFFNNKLRSSNKGTHEPEENELLDAIKK